LHKNNILFLFFLLLEIYPESQAGKTDITTKQNPASYKPSAAANPSAYNPSAPYNSPSIIHPSSYGQSVPKSTVISSQNHGKMFFTFNLSIYVSKFLMSDF